MQILFPNRHGKKYLVITTSYYRGANGFLLFYDITDRESFKDVNYWLNEIEKNAKKNVKIILIGNKTDLENKRNVTYEEGQEFAKSHNLPFIEISAKTNYNIQESIELLIKEMIKEFGSQQKKNNNEVNTFQLVPGNEQKRKKFC